MTHGGTGGRLRPGSAWPAAGDGTILYEQGKIIHEQHEWHGRSLLMFLQWHWQRHPILHSGGSMAGRISGGWSGAAIRCGGSPFGEDPMGRGRWGRWARKICLP